MCAWIALVYFTWRLPATAAQGAENALGLPLAHCGAGAFRLVS